MRCGSRKDVQDDALAEERTIERKGLVLASFAAHVKLVLLILRSSVSFRAVASRREEQLTRRNSVGSI